MSLTEYKYSRTLILNQLYGYNNKSKEKFTSSIFDDCKNEIQVDNRMASIRKSMS